MKLVGRPACGMWKAGEHVEVFLLEETLALVSFGLTAGASSTRQNLPVPSPHLLHVASCYHSRWPIPTSFPMVIICGVHWDSSFHLPAVNQHLIGQETWKARYTCLELIHGLRLWKNGDLFRNHLKPKGVFPHPAGWSPRYFEDMLLLYLSVTPVQCQEVHSSHSCCHF